MEQEEVEQGPGEEVVEAVEQPEQRETAAAALPSTGPSRGAVAADQGDGGAASDAAVPESAAGGEGQPAADTQHSYRGFTFTGPVPPSVAPQVAGTRCYAMSAARTRSSRLNMGTILCMCGHVGSQALPDKPFGSVEEEWPLVAQMQSRLQAANVSHLLFCGCRRLLLAAVLEYQGHGS
jgi:hypothetical protein